VAELPRRANEKTEMELPKLAASATDADAAALNNAVMLTELPNLANECTENALPKAASLSTLRDMPT
jgi:hypothetical protein